MYVRVEVTNSRTLRHPVIRRRGCCGDINRVLRGADDDVPSRFLERRSGAGEIKTRRVYYVIFSV